MKIGNIELAGDVLMAPLAGFTDVGFRDIVAQYGASLTCTEMVSCNGMLHGNEKTKELLATTDNERVKAVQVFGKNPYIMAKACCLPEMEKFDIIDINFGCPVVKIVENGEGSALLNDHKLAKAIVREIKSATGKVVTAKIRKGFKKGENIAVSFAKHLQDAGVDAVTVHGRTREDFYNGLADWDCIAEVAHKLKIPVIANGDICNLQDYYLVKKHTNCAGVMIGRGALGNPQVFKEIADNALKIDTIFKTVDKRRDIMTQIDTLKKYYSDNYIYSNMKKQLCHYVKGITGGKLLKDAICRMQSIDELVRIVKNIPFEFS